MDPNLLLEEFNELKAILQRYERYRYEFDLTGNDVARSDNPEGNATANAFNIMTVIVGYRDAMLAQSPEDQSMEQQDGKK